MRGQYYRRRYRRRDRRGNKGQDVSGRSMSILITLGLVAFFAILLSDKSNAPVLIGLLIIGVFCGVIYFFHQSRSLSDPEVSELTKVRRNRSIRAYYDFDTSEYNVDKRFKKNMAANGSFYNIDIRLRDFPATVAALLKYKKHEWAIVAFERNGVVDKMWLNKGPDGTEVCVNLSSYVLTDAITKGSYNTVLHFHNHPNDNPSYSSYTKPSNQDIKASDYYKNLTVPVGANLLEFVCERGLHYEYSRFVRDSFMPLGEYLDRAKDDTGKGGFANYSLRREIIKGNS